MFKSFLQYILPNILHLFWSRFRFRCNLTLSKNTPQFNLGLKTLVKRVHINRQASLIQTKNVNIFKRIIHPNKKRCLLGGLFKSNGYSQILIFHYISLCLFFLNKRKYKKDFDSTRKSTINQGSTVANCLNTRTFVKCFPFCGYVFFAYISQGKEQ